MPSDIFDEIEATPDTTTDIFDQIAPSPELLKERPAFEEAPIVAPLPVAPPPRVSRPIDLAPFAPSPIAAMAKSMEPSLDMERGIVSPEIVPTGAAISRATGLPKVVTVPASAVGRTAAGAVGYVTSPKGAAMTLGAATPAAPAVFAKWAYDMLKGGVESVKDATERVKSLIGGAITSGMISHNQLGLTLDAGKKDVDEAIQGLAEDAVNAAAMGFGGVGSGIHAGRLVAPTVRRALPTRTIGIAPTVEPAPVTGAVLRPPAERGVVTAIGPEILPPPGVEVPPPTPPPTPTPAPRAIPALPAVEPGFVRLFSGTRFPGSKSSWFSTNVKRAGEFAGDRGEVNYVDVPKEEFDAAAERAKEGGSFTPGDALLSNKWVNQAKSLREELIKRARPQAKPTTAADLEPALLVNDVPVAGGWDHEAIFRSKNTPELPVEEKMSLVEAYANDKQHIFVNKNTGERYTREQAAKILGEKDPLDSARLRELQGIPKPEAKAPPAPPATAPPPPATAAKPISRAAAGKALRTLVEADRDLVEQLAANHPSDLRLSEDGTRIIMDVDARSRGPGTGPKAGATTDFINWLMTTKGEGIAPDALESHMQDVIRAREIIEGKKPVPTTAAKEPWQMTQAESPLSAGGHRLYVERALREGKPVPPEVLRDYPDLAPKPAAPAVETKAQAKARAKEESDRVQTYAAGMVQSAGNYIRREIDVGMSAKDAALKWAREIGMGLMDTPDAVYKKERGGLYTSTYVKGLFGTSEGIAINAKEYLAAIDAGRQEGIAFKERTRHPPIGQGPGGKTYRASTKPEEPPETIEGTGLKHAIDELERVSYGFAARTLPEKQAMAAAWQRAGATLAQDADAGRRLTQALVLNPKRGLSADESALILRHKVGLENAVNDAAERTLTTTGDAKVEANAQLDRSRAELNDLLDAVAARGTEWGREGRWRQALAYEDYSFATQERLLSAAKGRPLTDAERVELQRQLADYKAKFDALEKSQSEREQRAVDIAVKEALDKVEKEAAAAPKYGPRVLQVAENFAKYMDAKGDAALQRLRERASRMSAGVDPAIVSDLAIWGASKATRGLVDSAKWADMAIAELGEWVRPHLEAAWEASKKLLNTELAALEKKVGKPTTTAVKKKISEKTTEENIADLSEKISTKLEENDLSAVAPLVRKLARFYVESGVRGRENLINSVHAVLQDIVPGITRSDTMRAIAGYGDYKLLPKDAVSIILRGYKGEMQQIAKLEDMAAGIAPAKTGIERRTPTEEERALIKQVEEAKKKGGYAVTDPETQLRTAMDAVKRRLENQIADLEKQISTREKIIKEPTRLEYDTEANQLKARRDELKKEFDEIFPKQPMTEAERLAKWKDRTQKRIAEIQEMILSGDIEIKPPKPPVALDVEGRRLQAALAESKENLKHAREKAEWEKMSVFQKARRGAVDSYDAARMLMTTGEFSFVLRQGKWTFLSRPLTTIRALPGMFQAMRNWRTAHEVDLKIFNDPEYPAAKAAKLHLIDESASLTRQEEIYAGRWAHAIPVVAHFNRAARVFLNKIRFDTWKAMRKSVGRDGVTTPAEDAAIATFVNESTGRGGLGFAEQAAVPMGRAFFAPRYTVSRFQLLAGHSLWKGSVRSRRVIATEYARALIGLGIYYSLLNAYFAGSKDKRRISLDPRSADFGKVRLGNTRLDPLAGVQQAAVFIGRTATGETVTQKGKTIAIRRAENVKPRYGDPTWTDIAARFARSKMHPVPGAIANLFSGTTMDGRATSFVKETGNLVGPITYFDIYSALNEQDIPDAMALSLLAVLGEGLQTYKPKK